MLASEEKATTSYLETLLRSIFKMSFADAHAENDDDDGDQELEEEGNVARLREKAV